MTSYEAATVEQVAQANSSGRTPVVFVHGLWLLPTSWDEWGTFFLDAGYVPVLVDWPDDPATVEEARAHPEVLASKSIGRVLAQVPQDTARRVERAAQRGR
jgi:non-heme chloroperoxidase